MRGWKPWLAALADAGRATRLLPTDGTGAGLWVAAERLSLARALYPRAAPAARHRAARRVRAGARRRATRRCASCCNRAWADWARCPRRVLAHSCSCREAELEAALLGLQSEGHAAAGPLHARRRGSPNGASAICWPASTATRSSACGARSNRSSRATSCASCSTGSTSAPPRRVSGPEALAGVLTQLEGYEAPAALWEAELLPARVNDYAQRLARRPVHRRPRDVDAAAPARAESRRGRAGSLAARHADPAAAAPQRRAVDAARARARRRRRAGLARAARGRAAWREHGASFFDEIARRRPPAGHRARRRAGRAGGARPRAAATAMPACARCWCPPSKRAPRTRRVGAGAAPLFGIEDAGRWSLARPPLGRRRRQRRPSRRRRRARRAHAAAPLRRGVLAPARARGRVAAALARPGARLPAAGSARRNPRRPLHRRPVGRAVRAARSHRRCMRKVRRQPPDASLVCLVGRRSRQPAGHRAAGRPRCRACRARACSTATACRSRPASPARSNSSRRSTRRSSKKRARH